LARELARKLGFIYIDTGAMYRALSWQILQKGINPDDPNGIEPLALALAFRFENQDGEQRLLCDGEDLTQQIRSPQIDEIVSRVASHPGVRSIMVQKQRAMARAHDVIMDGRDIGELVLPEADLKFYLTADLLERAARRSQELTRQGHDQPLTVTAQELERRDQMDQTREVGALKILPDSIVIDSSQKSAAEVLRQILAVIRERCDAL
jgi:CMP/dCMP kinase